MVARLPQGDNPTRPPRDDHRCRYRLLILSTIVVFFTLTASATLSPFRAELRPQEAGGPARQQMPTSQLLPDAGIPNQTAFSSEIISSLEALHRRQEEQLIRTNNGNIHEAFLQSGPDLQSNQLNVSFSAKLMVSSDGEVCFSFTVQETATRCPFPYIRVRLTGAALVHVPLKRRQPTTASEWEGCALLPVSGAYFVDANLIHCLMNPFKEGMTPASFKAEAGGPVRPDLSKPFSPHQFELQRCNRTASLHKLNAYPTHAWVFAPLCRNSLYRVARRCVRQRTGRFVSTKFQVTEWLRYNAVRAFNKPKAHARFDGYMWLPVDQRTGTIHYGAEHFGYQYTPPPRFLQQRNETHNQTMLFVGASHVRYLMNQVSQIYYNLTYGSDGCTEEHMPPPDLGNNVSRFRNLGEFETLSSMSHV